MRPSLKRSYRLPLLPLALAVLAADILAGGNTLLSILGGALTGSYLGTVSRPTRREKRQRREQELARQSLSDFDLELLQTIVAERVGTYGIGAFLGDLEQAHGCSAEEIADSSLRLEQCGLIERLEGRISGSIQYYPAGPETEPWLQAELERRAVLLEQSSPAPGPRSRASELAA